MLVQAVVDHDYLFLDICVGWAGSVHDARVFVNSLLHKKITEDGLLDGAQCLTFSGKEIPVWLVIRHIQLTHG